MTPVVTITLAGLPGSCPHCGEEPEGGQWPLWVQRGLVLNVACPACHVAVAPVWGVAAEDPECE